MGLYRGWIPTVSGRLSFSEVGHTRTPSRCIYANASDGTRRYVVCYQARDLSDALLPRWIREAANRTLLKRQGKFWFVLVAQTGPQSKLGLEELRGCVFLISSKNDWKKAENSLKEQVKDLQNEVLNYNKNSFINIQEKVNNLKNELSSKSDYFALFKIKRGGQANIFCPKKIGCIFFNKEKQYLLGSQVYYFLRDVCHRHQHHDSKTDTILNMYESKLSDDFSWRRETLYSIFRTIIQIKRTKKPDQIMRALGLLAYAKAFSKVNKTDKANGLPVYNFEALEKSLDASFNERNSLKRDAQSRWKMIFAYILSTLGLASSIALLGRTEKADSDIVNRVAPVYKLIVENPEITIIIVVFLVFLVSTVQPIIFNVRRSRFFRALVALAHAASRDVAVGFFMIPLIIFIILLIHFIS